MSTIIIDLHAFNQSFTGKHQYTLTLLNQLFTHPSATNHHFILASTTKLSLNLPPSSEWYILPKNPLKYYFKLAKTCNLKPKTLLISPTSFITPLISQCPTLQIIYDLAAWESNKHFHKNLKATFLEKTLLRLVVQKAQTLICISSFTQNELTSKFPHAKSKTLVIPGSPRSLPLPKNHTNILKNFNLKPESSNLKPESYFLFVGTLEPRKNLINLLHAYSSLIKQHPTAPPLFIAGAPGWHYQDIYHTHHQLGLGKRVKFLGSVTDDQIATLYHHSLCLTYIPFYEGFGLPIIESLFFGKPVITSNFSSLPEACGDCGILVNPNNLSDITQALFQISTNQKLYHQLQANISKHLKTFNSTTPINQLWDMITTNNHSN